LQSQRVTLRQVAAKAGVSVITASRALRAGTPVSLKVRQRVVAVAKSLKYVPDPAMSALVAHRHRLRVRKLHALIAVVEVAEPDGPVPGPRGPTDAGGLRDRAARLGYVVTRVNTTSDEASLRQTASDLLERGVRGVLLYRPHASVDDLPFVWDGFACVRLSGKPSVAGTHNVMINHMQGMTFVADELARRGYRRPGLVHLPHVSARSTYQWPVAYWLASLALPDAHPHPLALTEGLTEAEGTALLGRWVRENRLDCVLFAEEPWLLKWIELAGLRVPQDVGFCSMHADASSASGLTRSDLMGREVADLLNSLLQANDLGWSDESSTILVPMRWQAGTTLHRPRRGRERTDL